MHLIVIRHAKAEQRDPVRYPDDAQRPLTPKGREEQAAMARAFKRMGITFDHLVTSPFLRAYETADIIARTLKWTQPLDVAPVLGPEFSIDGVIAWLQQYPTTTSVACVGHEPDLSTLAGALLHPTGQFAIDFKKSGVMGFDFDGRVARGAGTLLYFLKPRQILALLE